MHPTTASPILSLLFLVLLAAPLAGCDVAEEPDGTLAAGQYVKGLGSKEDASALATVLDFEFDATVVTDWAWDTDRVIQDQLLYTVGQLNGENSVGRLDRLEVTDVVKETLPDGGGTKLTYHARIPVAWGSKTDLPTSYTLLLPVNVSSAGQSAFTEAYVHDCVESGAHDVNAGSMWYYYRPQRSGCDLADADVVRAEAVVTVSAVNTTGKYPEYHKVWEDDTLRVVAVFGKYKDGATAASDAGIAAYNEFVDAITDRLAPHALETTPETIPAHPGVDAAAPDIEVRAALADGRSVQVNILLVDNISSATPEFYARYEALSTHADLIAYNGHSGLGQNVRALAQKGQWIPEQYVIVFLNGCDTFAYVDGSLAEARAEVNPDDPGGTRFMDFVVNAMPAYFKSDSEATSAIIDGLLAYQTPQTYETIFTNIDSHQVVLVTGEEDNVYHPGYDPDVPPVDPVEAWEGLNVAGSVARDEEKGYQTPVLAAGAYVFELTGTHDADLYVRVGAPPTTDLYDCRPYRTGSDETCEIDLNTPAEIFVVVRGWAESSDYNLIGQ